MSEQPWLSVKEFAQHFHVSLDSIRYAIKQGIIAARHLDEGNSRSPYIISQEQIEVYQQYRLRTYGEVYPEASSSS